MKESSQLEFKESVSNTFLKTVSAFANYGGGTILFGVDDSGHSVGIPDPDQARLDIENRINDSISPNPDYSLRVDKKTGVISLAVSPGIHKPYLYHAKAYKRNDTATIETDRLELSRLILEGENLSFESTPSHLEHPTFHVLERELQNALGISEVTDDTLKTLELKNKDGSLTIAGELLSDTNTLSGIDCARFGDSINVFLDRETYEHISILEQYNSAVQLFNRYYRVEEIEGAWRVTRELIPEAAFREAVANALIHRQWDVSAHIRVSMHPDRVEVSSPGGLPQGITEEEYLRGWVSVQRNPIISNVFFRLGIIERFGTGVLRIKDAYRESMAKPDFSIAENSVTVVLPLIDNYGNLTTDEVLVLSKLRNREMPISDIVTETGFGKTKVQKLLKGLASRSYVTVVGNGRGTRYRA